MDLEKLFPWYFDMFDGAIKNSCRIILPKDAVQFAKFIETIVIIYSDDRYFTADFQQVFGILNCYSTINDSITGGISLIIPKDYEHIDSNHLITYDTLEERYLLMRDATESELKHLSENRKLLKGEYDKLEKWTEVLDKMTENEHIK